MVTRRAIAGLLLILSVSLFSVFGVDKTRATDEGSWKTKAQMPQQSEGYQAGVVNGKIYVIGSSTNYLYSPELNGWFKKTPMPTPRSDFALAVYQNKIYTIGGSLGWTQETGSIYSSVIEIYDTGTDTWETKDPMPTIRVFLGRGANVIQGKIHLIVNDTHDIYDIATDSWTTGKAMPFPYAPNLVSSTVLDDKIYILGTNVTQIYDPKSDSWTLGAASPIRVSTPGVCATTGLMAPKRIYVFGGTTSFLVYTNVTQVYDPETDNWTLGAPMLTARAGPACAVVDDIIYVIGGSSGMYSREYKNEQYTPIGYIPEFPSWIIIPIFLVVTLSAIIIRKKFSNYPPPTARNIPIKALSSILIFFVSSDMYFAFNEMIVPSFN